MRYIYNKQHYIDRYDLSTIEQCLNYYWSIHDRFVQAKDTEFAKYSEEKFKQEMNKCLNLMLNTMKGERYRHKEETIREWMEKDRRMQELYDKTPVPQHIVCRVCNAPATLTHKDLHNSYEPTARMTFMFACTKCKKRQILHEDGTEWKYESPKCPKCKHPLKTDIKIKGDISTYTSQCTHCNYKDKDVHDHAKFKREQEAKEKKEKELLEKYRSELCLSEKEGKDYLEYTDIMAYANTVKEAEIRKYDDQAFQKSLQVKKLTITELEKLLSEICEKEQYSKFFLDKPEMGQFVIVPFSAQDTHTSRTGYDKTSKLQKAIHASLELTNWRLTNEGISYRLGYVTGRLKGVERDEDMQALVGVKKEPKPSKEDEEKRMKYGSHNMVQLARLMGELEGIQNVRKRRLEKEPDGFLLKDGKHGYTCGVCKESMSGDNAWWDLRGIRCMDCQRNLKEGIIPLEIFEDDYGYDIILKSWNFRDHYGVHPSSVKKLRREGVLRGRDLKRKDGTVYHTIYLASENKEFLKKYPKKESKLKISFVNTDKTL